MPLKPQRNYKLQGLIYLFVGHKVTERISGGALQVISFQRKKEKNELYVKIQLVLLTKQA